MSFFIKIFSLFLLFLSTLYADQKLQREYTVLNKRIMLSVVVKNPKKDYLLFTISPSKHSKRIKSKELILLLKKYGYNNFKTTHSYIQFTQKSPIDTKKIEKALIDYYKERYKDIEIKKVTLSPNKYRTDLPKRYTIVFCKRAYLSHRGLLYIKNAKGEKIFFNYNIYAKIEIYETKKEIKKGEEISLLNCKKKSIIIDKFKAMPLLDITYKRYEAKHTIKKFSQLTQRDVVPLFLIKRGDYVTVFLQERGITISFIAKALQSGHFKETIFVLHKNRKIPVKVVGKKRAEVE